MHSPTASGWRSPALRLAETPGLAITTHMVAAIVHQEILRVLWERQIQGKPVGYGQKLFFLVDWNAT